MTPITAVIPTRFDVSHLVKLAPSLEDAEQVYIFDNGLTEENLVCLENTFTKDETYIIECHDNSIYEMWNIGQDFSVKQLGLPVHTAILNDDIYFLPGTLSILSKALDDDPYLAAVCPDYHRRIDEGIGEIKVEYTKSTFGHGGLAGFAFMVRGSLFLRVDENLGWWYGDDDLIKQIEAKDLKIAKVRGLPVEHYQGTSYKHIPNQLEEQIKLDMEYFNQKYGENRTRW